MSYLPKEGNWLLSPEIENDLAHLESAPPTPEEPVPPTPEEFARFRAQMNLARLDAESQRRREFWAFWPVFLPLTVAFALLFYRDNLHVWWLVLRDWIGTLYGLPWPADYEDMNALSYFVRWEDKVWQLEVFAQYLVYGAFLALFSIVLVQSLADAVRRRLRRTH